MPKHPGRRPGRPRKAERGDLVYWGEWKAVHDKSLWQIHAEDRRAPDHWSGNPQIRILMYGVVTGYKQMKDKGDVGFVGYYQVVRVTNPVSGQTYGQSVWLRSDKITRYGGRRYQRGPLVTKANERLGNAEARGCSCNCCAHTAIPRGQILGDGTFAWESTD